MSIGTVFIHSRNQAVRVSVHVRLLEGVPRVEVRVRGDESTITPLGQTWDSFFRDGPAVSDDFLAERTDQIQPGREPLWSFAI